MKSLSQTVRTMCVVGAMAMAAACGGGGSKADGSTGGSGGTGGGSRGATGECMSGTCTAAESKAYNDCLTAACGSQLEACYGPGYTSGNFTGPCAAIGNCSLACSCNDTACFTACAAQLTSECTTCSLAYGTCVQSAGCEAPACASGGNQDAGGIPDAGLPDVSFDVGISGTCADLQRCCGEITDATNKATCMQQYAAVSAAGDIACGATYSIFKAAGQCS